jgi:two-component system NarL family response regulator
MNNEIRVAVIDDHPLLRQRLLQVIESSPGLKVVPEAGDGEAALARIEELRLDIALAALRVRICQKLRAENQTEYWRQGLPPWAFG